MEFANNSELLGRIPVYFFNESYSDNGTFDPDINRDPLYVVIPITCLYGLIFIFGLTGNVSTCIVIAKNKSMHTATNYYLFSLAVSDLLLLVSGLPPEMWFIWARHPYPFNEAACVLLSFAAETSANATVLTITAFTVERYVAICHPFQAHAMSKLSRAVKFVLAIWVVALGLAVPQAAQFGLVDRGAPGESECTVKRVIVKHAFVLSTGVFFVTPMSLITILYILIGLRLRRARRERAGRPNNLSIRSNHAYSQSHVIRMLVAVVVAFFICWAPFHAQRLLAVHAASTPPGPFVVALYDALTYVSGVLYYLSTTVNPFLYHIMSNKFREAFKDSLARDCGWGRRRDSMRRSYSTLRRPTLQSSARRSTQRRPPRSPAPGQPPCGPVTAINGSSNVAADGLAKPATELQCFASPASLCPASEQTSPKSTPTPLSPAGAKLKVPEPQVLSVRHPANGAPAGMPSGDKHLLVRRSVSLESHNQTRAPSNCVGSRQVTNRDCSENSACLAAQNKQLVNQTLNRPSVVGAGTVRKDGAPACVPQMLRKKPQDCEQSSSDSGSGAASAPSTESNRASSASDFLTCNDETNSSCYQSTGTLVAGSNRWLPEIPDTATSLSSGVGTGTVFRVPRVLSLEGSTSNQVTGSSCGSWFRTQTRTVSSPAAAATGLDGARS